MSHLPTPQDLKIMSKICSRMKGEKNHYLSLMLLEQANSGNQEGFTSLELFERHKHTFKFCRKNENPIHVPGTHFYKCDDPALEDEGKRKFRVRRQMARSFVQNKLEFLGTATNNNEKRYTVTKGTIMSLFQCVLERRKQKLIRMDAINLEKERKVPNSSGYVYFIHEEGTSNFKIGMSLDPESRLAHLNTGNPRSLILKAKSEVADMLSAEKKLHELFKVKRSKLGGGTEWFSAKGSTMDREVDLFRLEAAKMQ
eukprot:TRINITY_DN3369_c0_g1_i2.p1 TRINITY_DN3369_c0_g1~~TRINITY_DN3369_c0_g1_i2.p1  ORF type:complete len:255 (-),score=44.08 TRINITY_DN3369_c0_g1_i2:710-1474(-)